MPRLEYNDLTAAAFRDIADRVRKQKRNSTQRQKNRLERRKMKWVAAEWAANEDLLGSEGQNQ